MRFILTAAIAAVGISLAAATAVGSEVQAETDTPAQTKTVAQKKKVAKKKTVAKKTSKKTVAAKKTIATKKVAAKKTGTSDSHLQTDVNFNDSVLHGRYQTPDEANARVENEKLLRDLLAVRTHFKDRLLKASEQN